jgi:SUMO ligase MMS21 Smc5/6 complex component
MTIDEQLRFEINETIEFIREMNDELNEQPKRPKRQRRNQYTHPIQSFKFQNTCSICLDSFNEYQDLSLSKCNHMFHKDCVVLIGFGKQSCPLCRAPMYIK